MAKLQTAIVLVVLMIACFHRGNNDRNPPEGTTTTAPSGSATEGSSGQSTAGSGSSSGGDGTTASSGTTV